MNGHITGFAAATGNSKEEAPVLWMTPAVAIQKFVTNLAIS